MEAGFTTVTTSRLVREARATSASTSVRKVVAQRAQHQGSWFQLGQRLARWHLPWRHLPWEHLPWRRRPGVDTARYANLRSQLEDGACEPRNDMEAGFTTVRTSRSVREAVRHQPTRPDHRHRHPRQGLTRRKGGGTIDALQEHHYRKTLQR